MVIVMDMDTGSIDKLDCAETAAEEFGEFVDEVLNAGWLPQPALRLETHDHAAETPVGGEDAEAFLRALYRNQE
ncbi:MAG: hypothetical protein AB1642_12300 [Pseudomonadota bacterium]